MNSSTSRSTVIVPRVGCVPCACHACGEYDRASSLTRASDEVRSYSPQAWQAHGTHPTRGTMTVERLVEEFIVGHLEEHADQLEALRGVRRG